LKGIRLYWPYSTVNDAIGRSSSSSDEKPSSFSLRGEAFYAVDAEEQNDPILGTLIGGLLILAGKLYPNKGKKEFLGIHSVGAIGGSKNNIAIVGCDLFDLAH